MSSSILHQCPFCGHVSDISLSLAAFIENPHCIQCGLSVSESNGKLQDELAALFDRQMAIDSSPQPQHLSYSISQHYHHSTHVAPSPKPPPQAHTDPTPIEILQHHGLDPSDMLPRQLDLFQNADAEQRQRLIQTWQLYARSPGESANSDATLTMEGLQMDDPKAQAEPYMVSGYQTHSQSAEPTTGQPYTSATDPVYKTQHWWEMAQTEPMESQYGEFQARKQYETGSDFAQRSLFH
ncbi:uncharacterized protein N7484_003764 [Penicillium longicatenatum]|uniref:uncharacterized protein n=1 Tax=Penicillium longicatenatum TaxID=1561947 RepID=UPI002547B4C3|nr:uncharacterized protein N7484_003764 [Penicillium longicatenatum]KAJ5650041.1 hypothetical protein N7484_003764 [Penicillium longicatenatum]